LAFGLAGDHNNLAIPVNLNRPISDPVARAVSTAIFKSRWRKYSVPMAWQ
jgi:hypothetical protein